MNSSPHYNSAYYLGTRKNLISLPGLLFVLAIHGALFYGLWQQRIIPPPEQMVTLFVDFIAAPTADATKERPSKPPKPVPAKLQPVKKVQPKPTPPRLVSKTPELPKEEMAVSEPEPEPVAEMVPEPEIASRQPQMPAGPVTLTTELSVSCPKLNAPAYPPISRRMGEEGKLMLRVELDEAGQVDSAEIIDSSGYPRLDGAAMAAVQSWECKPPLRDGQPARAIALQPFNFVLQGI